MAPNFAAAALLLLVLLLAVTASSAAGFNITKILGEFSDFSTFNDLLSQTKLAEEINRRQTITVLVVDNGAAGAISSLAPEVQRKVLAVHVVLDYYDPIKLEAIKNKSAVLTTLFQASGQAAGRAGFLNYTKRADGQMVFGSAEPGEPIASQMVKVVASRPYNISVMQVSSAIVPPSISSGGNAGAQPPAPAKIKPSSPTPAPTPPKSRKEGASPAPLPSNDDASTPAVDAPTPAAGAPAADAPASADAHAASPPEKSSDESADAPEGSGAAMAVAGAGVGIMGIMILMI